MREAEVRRHARTLWDYHRLAEPIAPEADFALAMGCCDLRVAVRAADLVLDGRAAYLVTSGGFGKISKAKWQQPEAAMFSRAARACGVSKNRILIEDQASNTGQNITYTRQLLWPVAERRQGSAIPSGQRSADEPSAGRNLNDAKELLNERRIPTDAGILVCKPYMERRSIATAIKQWPEVSWSVTSPGARFDDYPSPEVPFGEMVALMVGDLERIMVYPERGFQISQEVPSEVRCAYDALISAGYDWHRVVATTAQSPPAEPQVPELV